MRRIMAVVAAATMVMIPATVVAGDGDQEETVYDFEAEDLEGSLLRPDGEMFGADNRGDTDSLIDVREDFVPEMLESVESL